MADIIKDLKPVEQKKPEQAKPVQQEVLKVQEPVEETQIIEEYVKKSDFDIVVMVLTKLKESVDKVLKVVNVNDTAVEPVQSINKNPDRLIIGGEPRGYEGLPLVK